MLTGPTVVSALRKAMAPLALSSWVVLVAAAGLDPGHDWATDYVSWLSAGRLWPLAAAGVAGLVAATLGAAVHLHGILPPSTARRAIVAFLSCSVALGAAILALPSKGTNEPLWRTAAHVGLAVGAYSGMVGAAATVAWRQHRGEAQGPPMWFWGATLAGALAVLGLAATAVRLADAADMRGLAQLVAVGCAAAWISAVARLTAGSAGGTAQDS